MKTRFFIITLCVPFALHAQIITTIAGNGVQGFTGDGESAIHAEFNELSGLATDKLGNIYIVDWINTVIHKIDLYGIMTRFAGNGTSGYSGDEGPATAAQLGLADPTTGIAADTNGNVFFSDVPVIRMVNTFGIISTVAGNGLYGFSGDGGPATAAELYAPSGICFDKAGNMYISDAYNNNIRMINSSGIISTIAGNTIGFSGDGGPATNAQLNTPYEITIDDSSNIFFIDAGNYRIRKVNKLGIISTFAGCDPHNMSGVTVCEGCSATEIKLIWPSGIALDDSGNLYVSDAYNQLIYKINTVGLAYSIAGNSGVSGFSGDGEPASLALFNNPSSVCFNNVGDLLLIDKHNYRVRKIWNSAVSVPVQNIIMDKLFVYPNPVTHNEFVCKITTDSNEEAKIVIDNILGQVIFTKNLTTNQAINISLNVPAGVYFIDVYLATNTMQEKLVVE